MPDAVAQMIEKREGPEDQQQAAIPGSCYRLRRIEGGGAMSRGEAKRRFTLADHRAATEGVECRKDKDVIDETPAAYKDIDEVMHAQRDLVDVVHTLKQVVCVKG